MYCDIDTWRNDGTFSSESLTVKTISTKMQQLTTTSTGTLTYAPLPLPLPSLPFDLIVEILCRLPVNLLLQLRHLCKSFNSLISDPKFAKKQLRMSTTRHHLIVRSSSNSGELLLLDSPIHSVFSTSSVTQTQLSYPPILNNGNRLKVCSCDGILCINNILLFCGTLPLQNSRYCLLWKTFLLPYIALGNLGVLRDCLCIFENGFMILNVWIMKEYGNKESWTKLYTVPVPAIRNKVLYGYGMFTNVLYISEDDQMLVDFNELGVVAYDSKNGTAHISKIDNLNQLMDPKVYLESLISP